MMGVLFIHLLAVLRNEAEGDGFDFFYRIYFENVIHSRWIEIPIQRVLRRSLPAKRAIHRNMPIIINPPDMPVEVIRNVPLPAFLGTIHEPITSSIILIAKICHHHGQVGILQGVELLMMAHLAFIYDHWHFTFFTYAYHEFRILVLQQ